MRKSEMGGLWAGALIWGVVVGVVTASATAGALAGAGVVIAVLLEKVPVEREGK